jgi:hypothetical protein
MAIHRPPLEEKDMTAAKKPTKGTKAGRAPADAKLDDMIAEATVDAIDESEQMVGFFSVIEDNLALPFKTEVLGVEVAVERIELTDDDQIVALCVRGSAKLRVLILELPLPSPPPEGADWIAAFRRWKKGVK